jgi:hypothetical protein
MKKFFIFIIPIISLIVNQDTENLLKGTMISSEENSNLIKYAFDGNIKTQFMTNDENGWVGLKLREKNIITKIEWGQKEDDHNNYLLGVFEVSNSKTFEDAIPLHMIKEIGKIGEINSVKINFKKRFQYFRYVGPQGKYCKISVLNIYGYEGSESNSQYYQPTNLPLFVIHSYSGLEPEDKNDILPCNFYIINDNKIDVNNDGTLKIKGIESLKFGKKPYNVRFYNEQKPLNFRSKSKKWALLGNYGDKTLIRNILSFEISRIFNNTFTSECVFVDLMINGLYKGTYNLCDKIEVSETRVNIKKLSKNDGSSKISGGYLIEVDGFAYLGNSYFNSRKGIPITIKYPDVDDISSDQKNYIKEKFSQLELEIYNNNITNIDITSFVKFVLIEELIGNAEAYWSCFLYKERNDDSFYVGPIWDNEMIFDNDNRVYPINCKKDFIFNNGLSAGTMDKFINQILKNNLIINKIIEIWEEITKTKLNMNYLSNFIDSQINLINESKTLNFIRWNISNIKVSFNPKIYSSYEEEIDYIKGFIYNRINWLNNYILGTKYEIEANCSKNEESVTRNELIYEMDNINDIEEIDYELLSFSMFIFKKDFFIIFLILLI